MAIRLSNKKSVNFKINLLLLFLVFSAFILSVFGMLNAEHSIINPAFSFFNVFYLGVIFLIIATFIMYSIYRQKILEYDSTSEVLSIKYVTPELLKYLNISTNDVFELPKEMILNLKLESDFLGKYVVVTFRNSNNKIMKRYFEISSCSREFIDGLGNDVSLINDKDFNYG